MGHDHMKTKDLIRLLNELDPTGEGHACIGNKDILSAHWEGSYYDGCLQVLKREGDFYEPDIVGAEIRSKGRKLVIEPWSISDALWNEPDMPVAFDGDFARKNYAEQVEKWRTEVKESLERMRQARMANAQTTF